MKMILSFLFLTVVNLSFAQDEKPYFGLFNLPEKGYETFTFTPNNELKERPNANSKTKIVLPINTKISIDTAIKVDYSKANNLPEYFRVKYKGKVGYLKSEQLAICRFEIPKFESHLLFQLNTSETNEYGINLRLHCKELYRDTFVYEHYFELNSHLFQLEMTGTRGLDSIEQLLYIDYISEACGEQGGEDIYSWSPSDIRLLANFNAVGDGGVYYYIEHFVFPSDSGGIEKKLLYFSEEYNLYDEESEWYSQNNTQRIYNWIGGEIVPPFKRDPFSEVDPED